MGIIKCKMCGGDMEIGEGISVAECEYCGTKQTVPNVDNEKKLTLFSRANRLRLACEFDKAASVYENLVAEFPEEAEAYWGLVLCKYGIEYVDDPATGKKIPTCHRSSFESILEDSDFEQACENADVVARRMYREEAKVIEQIRRDILEVSGKERPYDIFICYKETDENGQRTLDSVLAQDVYDALTEKGYRVFFSRITLEDKLGTQYEPYIFAALNSARVMLVFGTDYEYINAVWVKNEWSRFLKLMAKDKNKHLIPCYKNIDAYDMPKEFQKLQGQDLGKVGATQDLLRGIEKLLNNGASADTVNTSVTQEAIRKIEQEKTISRVENAVSMGALAMDAGDNEKAKKYFEEALMLDSECIGSYLGLLRLAGNQQAETYARKVREVPIDKLLNYIREHLQLLGDPNNTNNLLTVVARRVPSDELISGLLDLGAKGSAKSALIWYLNRFENAEIVERMIESGANPKDSICWTFDYKVDSNQYVSYTKEIHTALVVALWRRRPEPIIRALVRAGADVNYVVDEYDYYCKQGENGKERLKSKRSVLSLAIDWYKTTDVPKLLIKAGADVNFQIQERTQAYSSIYGYYWKSHTILGAAVFNDRYNVAELLLKHGADPNLKRKIPESYQFLYDGYYETSYVMSEYSPITDTIWKTKNFAMLELLLKYKADPNTHDKRPYLWREKERVMLMEGWTEVPPLKVALENADDAFFEKFLAQKEVDPNVKYCYEKRWGQKSKSIIPVLGVAILEKQTKKVEMLLDAGASFSEKVSFQEEITEVGKENTYKIDEFLLSEYDFTKERLAEMGSLIRAHGWRGKAFLGKSHRCYFGY